jgi:hypothetical protein
MAASWLGLRGHIYNLNIKIFFLMSRDLENRGGHQKASNTRDFANVIQPIAGDGDEAADGSIN